MQKPSGLFDRDKDVALLTTPAETLADKTADDIFKNFGSKGSVCDEYVTPTDENGWKLDDSFGTLDDVFGMDIFTDLSQFIAEDSTSTSTLVNDEMTTTDWQIVTDDVATSWLEAGNLVELNEPNISSTSTDDTAGQRKRKLSEVSIVSSELDHGNYTVKRSKVNSASDDDDDAKEIIKKHSNKYVERRIKNNVASKRSRDTRKQKFVDMEQQAVDLVEQNEMLTKKIAEMEKLAVSMKHKLVQFMAKK